MYAQMKRDALGYAMPQFYDKDKDEFVAVTREVIAEMVEDAVKREIEKRDRRRVK